MSATFGISMMLGNARDVPAAKLGTKRGALSGSAGMAGKAAAAIVRCRQGRSRRREGGAGRIGRRRGRGSR